MAGAKKDKIVEEKAEVKVDCKEADISTETPVILKHLSIKLPESVHRRLKAKSALDGESTSNVLKRLILEYVKDI